MRIPLVLLSLLGSLTVCQADAVRLQINGPDGKPVAGAKVRVSEGTGLWFERKDLPARDFESDANGVIALESKGPLATDPIDRTRSRLVARVLAPGLAAAALPLQAGSNTATLAPAQTLEGVTLDGQEKPLGGVRLAIIALPSVAPKGDRGVGLPAALQIETTSDAQGHWKIEGMPRTGRISVEVQDSRFRRESFPLDVAQKTPPLFLVPGATIKGRLLRPDGKGAAGVRLFAGDSMNQPVTDANGRFESRGLGNQPVYLQVTGNDQKLPFILRGKAVNNLKPGEVRDIGDWKTEKGVRLRGRLVNANTQKAITKALFTVVGREIPSDVPKPQNGEFDLLVEPDIYNFSVQADGYVQHFHRNFPDAKNGVIDLGIISLRPGRKVSGMLVDQAGNPLGGVGLFVQLRDGDRLYASTDSTKGRFSFAAVETGNYTVKSDGIDLIAGTSFTVAAGQLPSLRVVAKRKRSGGQKNTLAESMGKGRVVDSEGNPVAGAKIALRAQSESTSYSDTTAFSQSDGTFDFYAAPSLSDRVRVLRVDRPGFVRASEKIEQKDGKWRVELTLQKRGVALRGRVVDSEGKPVKGAFVGLQTGTDWPVATDENGAFALVDAPQVGVPLLASNGPSLATFTPQKVGEPIEVVLPAAAAEDKAALADEALVQSGLPFSWQSNWNVLGQKRIEATLLARTDARGEWLSYLDELTRREPHILLARENELRAQTPARALPGFERLAMLARASSSDATQQEQARAWLKAQEETKRDISPETVSNLLALAQIGAKLGSQERDMWLDYAVEIAAQLDLKRAGENAWSWGILAARVSPDAPSRLSTEWSSTAQMQLLVSAMRTWARDKNAAAAKNGWAKMQLLAADAAQHPDTKVQSMGYRQKPADMLSEARYFYTLFLARTNPKAALAVVGPASDRNTPQALIAIARSAAKAKQFEVAREAIARLGAPALNATYNANAAAIADEFDATLAAKLWAKARPANEAEDGLRGGPASFSYYAGERAKNWPGESRILLEREWAARLANPGPRNDFFDPNDRGKQGIAEAMARINGRRALEMAATITDRQEMRAQTRGDIALALLAQ